ncbi:peroxide stress protein YaaA [Spirosoma validum]|uniref:Peroxide stress protein YaaA n=1 Tax=Spirosoma validum TaxID=2771355 RepID=A0A927GCG5_9BACT|nr:peroxide stress protein YaaA [Spirosoma validum]MBD2752500.1 peroxide stress protein YaaA [Spirosoma validum]
MAYLITCANCKTKPVVKNPSQLDRLAFHGTLFVARTQLIKLADIDLDWNYTLPAWELYSGKRSKLYPQIAEANWKKPCVDINIISALFGWIKHTDLIPYYDLKMDARKGEKKQLIWRVWQEMNVLQEVVSPGDIDLLSQLYRKAVNENGLAVATVPTVRFTDRGVQKGIWLNHQLNNVLCD